ncbi:MAG: hypothetical protein OMM_05928 [Candidatus Magnetoglobus multicellularis str. Araruama]|uniref:Dystroglycan-type cadherin-like domain-containing protein n=1 Tax=Candidatus Magnetoglobus multicellularis str. Araruama TaxID=890399 RepID=A0A1V1NT67_9BACT|nr:MAG: hypothetical protein OMM_05928 [Candidatus Magnetoglobus multicellularis str. Araruama]
MWGSSGSDVFAVGFSGIFHYDGNNWTTMSGTLSQYNGVWGSSGSDVFAVCDYDTISHYDGNNWTTMNTGTSKDLNEVWGSNSSDVYAVGDSGTILKYDVTVFGDQTIDENSSLTINFSVSDADSSNFTVTAISSDVNILPNENISITNTNKSYTITVFPTTEQAGSLTVTVQVADPEGLTAVESFILTVRYVNDIPVIGNISDQITNEDTAINSISFTATDVESSACQLTVTFDTSNQSLIPNDNITYACNSDSYALSITPASNESGYASITVAAYDGNLTATTSFGLTVNGTPAISNISSYTTNEDTAINSISFTATDVESSACGLTVTFDSSNEH